MKKIIKTFIILFISLVLTFGLITISKAENETSDPMQVENLEDSTSHPDKHKNVFSFTQENVNIDYNIEGDLFICCAGNVTIDSLITGNVFVCSRNVEITENALIEGSLFNVSQSLMFKGYVDKNIYSVCGDITLSSKSTVGLDVFMTAQNMVFDGNIMGDANVSFENINISNEAMIKGNLTYSSDKEAEIAENIVNGKIVFNKDTDDLQEIQNNKQLVSDWVRSVISSIVFVIVVYCLLKYLVPNFINEKNILKLNVLKSMLFGFIGLIIIPIVSLILLILGITSSIGFLLITTYISLLIISTSISLILVSNLLKNKFGEKLKEKETLKQLIFLTLTVILYKALKLIPVVGGLISFIAFITGLGICINYVTHKKSITE